MRVDVPYDISNFTYDDPLFISNLAQAINRIALILNAKLTFGDNFQCKIMNAIFITANSQQAYLHGLNRLPVGYIKIGSKAATTVYNGTNANTTQAIYLQANVATTVTLIIF